MTEILSLNYSEWLPGLDEEIAFWRNRPLEKNYPYLIVDARYEKVRKQGKVVSQGVLIILGVDEDGYREILAVDLANTETEESWSRVFRDLRKRGLKGVLLVISDDHEGLRSAQDEILSRSRVAEVSVSFSQYLLSGHLCAAENVGVRMGLLATVGKENMPITTA